MDSLMGIPPRDLGGWMGGTLAAAEAALRWSSTACTPTDCHEPCWRSTNELVNTEARSLQVQSTVPAHADAVERGGCAGT